MAHKKLMQEAVEFRKQGKSYSEIKKEIGVSKSTLSTWLRNIELTEIQQKGLIKKRSDAARIKAAQVLRAKRISRSIEAVSEGWNNASKEIKNPLFILGTALYWAEGGKTAEKISFSNSDPLMIKLIMKWLQEYCAVPISKIKAQLHIHTLHSKKNTEQYWSKITHIPLSQFTKTYIKKTSLGYRKNKLYRGTIVIRVHSSKLFRNYIGWRLGLLEYFNIISFNKESRKKFTEDIAIHKKYKLF